MSARLSKYLATLVLHVGVTMIVNDYYTTLVRIDTPDMLRVKA